MSQLWRNWVDMEGCLLVRQIVYWQRHKMGGWERALAKGAVGSGRCGIRMMSTAMFSSCKQVHHHHTISPQKPLRSPS